MKRQLTGNDVNMLKYYWEEKEDIERFSGLEDISDDLNKRFPEILKAWRDYNESRRRLTIVINNALDEIISEE